MPETKQVTIDGITYYESDTHENELVYIMDPVRQTVNLKAVSKPVINGKRIQIIFPRDPAAGGTQFIYADQVVICEPNGFKISRNMRPQVVFFEQGLSRQSENNIAVIQTHWFNRQALLRLNIPDYVFIQGLFFRVSITEDNFVFTKETPAEGQFYFDLTQKEQRRYIWTQKNQYYVYVGDNPHYLSLHSPAARSSLASYPVLTEAIQTSGSLKPWQLSFEGKKWNIHQNFSAGGQEGNQTSYIIASLADPVGEEVIRLLRKKEGNFEMVEEGLFWNLPPGHKNGLYVHRGRIWDMSLVTENWQALRYLGSDPNKGLEPGEYAVFIQNGTTVRPVTLAEIETSLEGLRSLPSDYRDGLGRVRTFQYTAEENIQAQVNLDPSLDPPSLEELKWITTKDQKPISWQVQSYRVAEGEKIWTYRIYAPPAGVNSGYFVPAGEADVLALHQRIRGILPNADSLLLKEVEYIPGHDPRNAAGDYSAKRNHMRIFGVAGNTPEAWATGINRLLITHEVSGHGRERDTPPIFSLLMRTMILDSMTMEYGFNNPSEYFATLAEYYFHAPQALAQFPYGARLVHEIMLMANEGLVWAGVMDSVYPSVSDDTLRIKIISQVNTMASIGGLLREIGEGIQHREPLDYTDLQKVNNAIATGTLPPATADFLNRLFPALQGNHRLEVLAGLRQLALILIAVGMGVPLQADDDKKKPPLGNF